MTKMGYSRGTQLMSLSDKSHMIDHDAEALMRGERVDAENTQREYTGAEVIEALERDAERRRFVKTDEHGRKFRVAGVVRDGEMMSSEEWLQRILKGRQ